MDFVIIMIQNLQWKKNNNNNKEINKWKITNKMLLNRTNKTKTQLYVCMHVCVYVYTYVHVFGATV